MIFSDLHHRNDNSNTFVGVNREPNYVQEGLSVYELDIFRETCFTSLYASVNYDYYHCSKYDEYCYYMGPIQLLKVSYPAKWSIYHKAQNTYKNLLKIVYLTEVPPINIDVSKISEYASKL